MTSGPRVLVTGSGGHVGGRLAQLLINEDCDVVRGFRRLPDVSNEKMNHPMVVGDLSDLNVREAALDGVGIVAHLATRGFSSLKPPSADALLEETNTTLALAEACVRRKVKRFLFVSSVRVYGDTVEGDISELSTTNPTDLLGCSKLELEDRLLSLATNDFQVLVVRLSNSFGVAANPLHTPWDLLINDLCMEAISKGTMSIRTNGRQFRDFVPLGEVVRAIRSLLHHEMTASGVFLLASGVTRTVSQTATLLADSLSPHLGFRPEISLNETDLQQYRPFRFDTRKLSSMGISIQNDWTSEVKLLVEAVRQTNRTVSR